MKIAILGGGFAGLSAAYYLIKKGHQVTIFEKELILGGLAVGFKEKNWDWPLERAYHHLFASDKHILSLAKESSFDNIFFHSPETASFYKVYDNYRIFPVDTPQDFLKFPLLPLFNKLRAAVILACLKFSPFLSLYERYSAEEFFTRSMGKRAWNMIFGELMRKKFGKYAGNILASFIWARIKVRTKSLGYIKGGFQTFVEHLEKINTELGVFIKKSHEVQKITKRGEGYIVTYKDQKGSIRSDSFDAVISTLPSVILARMTGNLFPVSYFEKFKKLHYLNAVVLIVESKKPILKKTYWLNICDPETPLMIVAQHTNFMDPVHYGGSHLAYIGWYVDQGSEIWNMDEKTLVRFITPHLKKINPQFDLSKTKRFLFKAPFAQPVFDRDFVENKPDFQTPLKNFYIANLDMTYPNDRGTNYAVKLGKEVADRFF